MTTINDLIEKNNEANKGKKVRKTKNSQLFLKTIVALTQDKDYKATRVKSVDSNGEITTEKVDIASGFKDVIVDAYTQAGMTPTEAKDAYDKKYTLSTKNADKIRELTSEAIKLNIDELGKKVQLIHTPDIDATLSLTEAKESIRSNPKDPSKKTKIKAHKKVKIENKIHAFQKETMIL